MYSVKVNEKYEHSVTIDGGHAMVDGKKSNHDIIRIDENRWHIISDHVTYLVELVKADAGAKEYVLKVNGNKYQVQLKDELDQLLQRLGLDKMSSAKVNEVKAPMPGLVLKALVKEGDAVKKGDGLLVLEAMKMENVIKSPSDGVIKAIPARVGTPVEKNQVLIQFE